MPDNNLNNTPNNATNGGQAAAPAKKSSKTGLIIGGIIVALAAIAIVVMVIIDPFSSPASQQDPAAEAGQAPYKTEEEMRAELDRTVDEGMLNISIASEIKFADGASEGTAYIENTPSNRYDMSVSIALETDDDTDGPIVYESGILPPNSFIEKITLNEVLPAGDYPAIATFTAYDPDTQEKIGQAAAKITLVVES